MHEIQSTASQDPQVILFIGNNTHSTYAHVHHQMVFMTIDGIKETPVEKANLYRAG